MKRSKLKISKTDRSHTSAIITSTIIALLLSVLLTALMGNIMLSGHLSEKTVTAGVFLTRSISVLVGVLIGASMLKQHYLKLVSIISAVYFVTLIGTGIVFFDGSFQNFLLGVISVLIGGVAALLILLMPKRNRRKLKIFAR